MGLTVENVCGLIIRSRLQPVDAVQQTYQRWQTQAADKDDLDAFCTWLIDQGFLTRYQVTRIAQGHADGFFIGPYRIVDRIDADAGGQAFRALGPNDTKAVIHLLTIDETDKARRVRERVKRLSQLSHPCLVRFLGSEETNRCLYLVREEAVGETLADVLRRRRLSPRESTRIGYQVALALRYLHDHGFIAGRLRASDVHVVAGASASDLTRASVKLVPADLALPDADAPRAIAADLRLLGQLLYETLAGRPPRAEEGNVKVPPLRRLRDDVPSELDQLVMKLLAGSSQKGYATAAQVAEALQLLLAGSGTASRPVRGKSVPASSDKPGPGSRSKPAPPDSPKLSKSAPKPSGKAKSRRTSKTPVPKNRVAEPPPQEAPVAAPLQIDVEPVTLRQLVKAPFGLPIPRDVFMVAVGAVGGLVIGFAIAWILSLVLSRIGGGG